MLYIISKTIALAGDPSKSSNNNGKRIKNSFYPQIFVDSSQDFQLFLYHETTIIYVLFLQ